ncbi:MotA/TolQ/ExbB proton channel family protein [Flavobacteriaceae bacterium XHP0103]|uniref:MotA/TolQ/ExbB proton channel family protein n=1 Tax=Marixanthotalea marina TaxID=2844359 RepID=UPI00298A05C7|nr:MotA/TolQ/ExbB proton channel family protein [Marixanthotalea marina]MBU3821680.1 MotA/TolQ/ExbB proton channel family protein [Marixanthotalea marina]
MKMLLLIAQNNSIGGVLADRFNEGGPLFMSLILICLILSVLFIILTTINLNKNEAKFKKMISLIGDASLLGLVIGILGSLIGMIEAFDAIGSMDGISSSMIAGGLKVSFLTMVFGMFTFIISRIAIIILKWFKKV